MIQCAIIDDEPMAVDVLTSHVNKIPFLALKEKFTDAIKAIEWLQSNTVDLLFLDIDMPDISGIQLLRSLSHPPRVIFTTAHPDYALESYDFETIDYLLKPITFPRFLKAANKAQQMLLHTQHSIAPTPTTASPSNTEDILHLKSGTSTYRIALSDIAYIEGTGNYLTVHTSQEKIMVLQTMKQMLEQLPPQKFMRIHKSYIASKRHIRRIEKASLEVLGQELPIGSTYREAFSQWI